MSANRPRGTSGEELYRNAVPDDDTKGQSYGSFSNKDLKKDVKPVKSMTEASPDDTKGQSWGSFSNKDLKKDVKPVKSMSEASPDDTKGQSWGSFSNKDLKKDVKPVGEIEGPHDARDDTDGESQFVKR